MSPTALFRIETLDLNLVNQYDEGLAWKFFGEGGRPFSATASDRADEELRALGVRLLGSASLHETVVAVCRDAGCEADVLIALDVLHDEGVVDLGAGAVDAMAAAGIRVSG